MRGILLAEYFVDCMITVYVRIKLKYFKFNHARAHSKYLTFRYVLTNLAKYATPRTNFDSKSWLELAEVDSIYSVILVIYFPAFRAFALCIFKYPNRVSLAPDQRPLCVPLYRSVQRNFKAVEATGKTVQRTSKSNSRTMGEYFTVEILFSTVLH